LNVTFKEAGSTYRFDRIRGRHLELTAEVAQHVTPIGGFEERTDKAEQPLSG
jgi:hypothetical protein